ncbi:caspase domain-containing protein [Gilbertella persicaria]|uniref:caspase domain-containing protein n=1 Tax=Gilbertella persicaria TaxID=101096 RepID=UPI00221E90B9|nr:caspase domain-containing protein [Gilbertella persicaria]KAI8079102.1 caspase domain-containing protein [Gilbertella persicaria]
MSFSGPGYTTGGYMPYPPPQGQYPPQPPQPQNPYPPPGQYPPGQCSPYYGQPPPQQPYYPPPPPPQPFYGQTPHYSVGPPLPPRNEQPPPPPPPYTPDPIFSPSDPTVAQANYPQQPYSSHNPSPHPVPYGTPSSVNPNDFIMHVDPRYQQAPPQFQLSNCQGRKRALLIGINYFGQQAELKGCINDVHNVKHFLISMYNFRQEDMVILTDDQMDPQSIPTKQNIIRAMQWLVHDNRPNDSFFLHFSGHGGRMRDYDGDEDDGYDETIYPVDHSVYGQIVDDMMNDILVRPLVVGCRLTAVFDSCHSGTALDLPYVYSTKGALKESNFFRDTGSTLKNAGRAYLSGDATRAISSVMSIGNKLLSGNGLSGQSATTKERIRRQKGSAADVIMFSGCKDDQTSADTTEAGMATGAMSYAITTALRQNRNQTYLQLLNSVRFILKQKYNQRPQLSSSHPMDMNLLFMI